MSIEDRRRTKANTLTGETLTGGCQCGAVRYTIELPVIESYHCHCQMCRKLHGAIFGTWTVLPRRQVTIDQGIEQLANYDSSPPNHRKFCRNCGCYLFCDDERDPDRFWVSTGSLDDGAFPGGPVHHIFVAHKAPWYPITDDLPQHEEF